MEILLQLGANETVFIQFILFVISITFLTVYVFGPYFKANDERNQLTRGADKVATETQDEAKKLQQIYQLKAREQNEKIKNIFETSQVDAKKTAAIMLDDAKNAVAQLTSAATLQISEQKQVAKLKIKDIASDISEEISNKLTGKV